MRIYKKNSHKIFSSISRNSSSNEINTRIKELVHSVDVLQSPDTIKSELDGKLKKLAEEICDAFDAPNQFNKIYDGFTQLIDQFIDGIVTAQYDRNMSALNAHHMRDVSVRDWYHETYPTDDIWKDINDVTFGEVYDIISGGSDFYREVCSDSVVRERIFEELAESMEVSYDFIYDLYMSEGNY